MKSVLSHPALTVKPHLGALGHVRRFYQVVGFSSPHNYLVHNSSLNNLSRGVLTRVLLYKGRPTPKPLEWIYGKRLGYFRNLLLRKFNSTTPIDRQQFVEYYEGRKRTIYQKAVESLLSSSISPRDATIKAFVKAEFINSDDKPDPDPRVISPRDPRYNVEVGRYLRPIEHRIYSGIADIFGAPTVLKGFNSQQSGKIIHDKWSKYYRPVAVGLDASRFDQHVSIPALKWEHSVYNGIYHSKELAGLLRMQLFNNVVGYCRDGKLKYKTEGCRMSGDMNTGLGNCLIMCALIHCWSRDHNLDVSLVNNGDDCVVILEEDNLHVFMNGLSEWFLEMGFNMKIEKPVYEIEQIEFCQTHPIWTPEGYIMVRNFPKSIAKDCLSMKDLKSRAVCKAWLNAVGEGGLSLTGGIPVYQEFYCSYIRAASSIHVPSRRHLSAKKRHVSVAIEGGLAWLSKGMQRKRSVVHPRTRYSFWLAFGTTPDRQLALEEYYSRVGFEYRFDRSGKLTHLPGWF